MCLHCCGCLILSILGTRTLGITDLSVIKQQQQKNLYSSSTYPSIQNSLWIQPHIPVPFQAHSKCLINNCVCWLSKSQIINQSYNVLMVKEHAFLPGGRRLEGSSKCPKEHLVKWPLSIDPKDIHLLPQPSFVIPWTVSRQVPLSTGFSRQEC